MLIVALVIGDAMLVRLAIPFDFPFLDRIPKIYRLWVVWQKNYWIIILPSLIAVGGVCESLMDDNCPFINTLFPSMRHDRPRHASAHGPDSSAGTRRHPASRGRRLRPTPLL